MMWTNELTRPTADFTRKSFPAFIRHYAGAIDKRRSRGEWLRLLRSSYRDGVRQIRAAGEVRMLQYVRRFDGERGTRLTWMHHGIAHEEYHRAQIALYARLLGRTPGPDAGDRGRGQLTATAPDPRAASDAPASFPPGALSGSASHGEARVAGLPRAAGPGKERRGARAATAGGCSQSTASAGRVPRCRYCSARSSARAPERMPSIE